MNLNSHAKSKRFVNIDLEIVSLGSSLNFLRSPSLSSVFTFAVHCVMDVCLLLRKYESSESLAYAPPNITIFYIGNTLFLEHFQDEPARLGSTYEFLVR